MEQPSERLHALDAVRGLALTLGVVFHATASFIPGPQVWMVVDQDRGVAASVLFFVLHMFRMTIFFVMAGYFGRLVLERRGTRAFVADRAKRITLPLVAFWPILFGLIVAATIFGAWMMTGGDLSQAAPPPERPDAPPLAFPLTHLWFLYLLLWFYAGALVLRIATRALGGAADGLVRFIMGGPVGPVLVALPLFSVFMFGPFVLPWFGIPTPDQSLLPNPAAVVGYGVAFGFGWLLHRQPSLMRIWERRWAPHLVVALAATVAALALLGVTPSFETPDGWRRLAAAACYTVGVWAWTFGLIGAALRFLSGESAWRRYLADASYWIYLIHLPLVIALQATVSQLGLPWEIKYLLVLAVAFPIMLGSYQVMVRYTWLGAILNGRRHPRPAKLQLRSAEA